MRPGDWWVRAWGLLAGMARRTHAASSPADARRWFRAGQHFGRALNRQRDERELEGRP